MKIVTFIPARGGSKGLKRKNLQLLADKPLISWPIQHASQSKYVTDVVVTTDDKEIAKIAEEYGAKVPFLRPNDISGDLATTEETLKHALIEYEKIFGEIDLCLFLTCTDVFRRTEWIDQAIEIMLSNKKIESVFSGHKTHKNFWQKNDLGKWERLKGWMSNYSSRQVRRYIVREDTGLCCVSRPQLWRDGKRIGDNVEILENDDFLTSVDIHSKEDLKIADTLLRLRFEGLI